MTKKADIKVTRDDLRAKLLGQAPKPQIKTMSLFGQEIELRQPTLGAILDAQGIDDDKIRTVTLIIEYAYVPGTDERIFEEADTNVILSWPFGEELVEIQVAIAGLTGVDISAAEEKLKDNPLGKRS